MQQLKEVFQRSTVHGLAHAANAHSRPGEIFWATLCISGLAAFLYNVSFTLQHYYSLPMLTSYFSNADYMDWPDFTFCNQVPVSLSDPAQLREWRSTLDRASAFEDSEVMFEFFQLFRDKELMGYPNITFEDKLLVNLTMALSTIGMAEKGADLKRTFLRVGYNRGQRAIALNVQIDNNIEMFELSTDHVASTAWFGRYRLPCHTIQIKRLFSEVDESHKLEALFFFILNDFHSYMLFNSAYFHQGTRIYIHDPDTVPSGQGILIVPGHSQHINFKAVVTHHMIEKRHCRKTEVYVDMYGTSLQTARRVKLDYSLCKLYVSAKQYYQSCLCYTPFLPAFKFDNSTPHLCFNMTIYSDSQIETNARCLAKVYSKFSDENLFQELLKNECSHVQQTMCVRTEYNIESSDYMWPELWSEDLNSARMDLMRDIAVEVVARKDPNLTRDEAFNATRQFSIHNVSSLLRSECSDVYIRARSVFSDQVIETPEYPFTQLMSDIGGLLGLYLGLSIVGLFESVEMVQALLLGIYKLLKTRWLRQQWRHHRGRGYWTVSDGVIQLPRAPIVPSSAASASHTNGVISGSTVLSLQHQHLYQHHRQSQQLRQDRLSDAEDCLLGDLAGVSGGTPGPVLRPARCLSCEEIFLNWRSHGASVNQQLASTAPAESGAARLEL